MNTVLEAPNCAELPVFIGENQIVSVWELSGDEMMSVLQTGKVYLRVMGTRQPPIALQVETPFHG